MSEQVLEALEAKRAELEDQVAALHTQIYAINETLRVMGLTVHRKKGPHTRFRKGELTALVGRAEREGKKTPGEITTYIMQARGWDASDKKLHYTIRMRVKDCLKRLRVREADLRALSAPVSRLDA